MLTYSNPRTVAEFSDWPFGRDLKTPCAFTVETVAGKGQRVSRVTIDPKTGRACAPKRTTFARRAVIVDGDDGKTYVLALTMYGLVSVMQSNLQFSQESLGPEDPRFNSIRAFFGE